MLQGRLSLLPFLAVLLDWRSESISATSPQKPAQATDIVRHRAYVGMLIAGDGGWYLQRMNVCTLNQITMSVILNQIQSLNQPRQPNNNLIPPNHILQPRQPPLKPFRKSRQIRHTPQMIFLQSRSHLRVRDKRLHERLPLDDRGEGQEGLFEPLGEESGAEGGFAAV